MLLNTGDNGNVFQIQNNRDTTRSVNYDYDELNRIKSAATVSTSGPNCWGQLFGHMNGGTYVSGYDAWANLKEISVSQCSAPMLSLSVNGNNRLTNTGFAYDAAGNMTNDANHQYGYDAENRLVSIANGSYTYDGDGKRVKKSGTATTPTLYWTGTSSDPLAESDLSGTISEEYVFFNGKRIARLDLPGGAVHYYFSDHLGSASVVTNATGATIEQESDYYPYGGERVLTAGANNYKFTGKERDSETGLDYFGARYYGSNMGRWMSPDWSTSPEPVPFAKLDNPQSLNLYGYVLNNPATNRDPDGHICIFGIGNTCKDSTPPPPPPTPDPAGVRPKSPPAPQAKPKPPKRGLTVGYGRAGNAEAGASRLGGSGANASAVVVRSYSLDGKTSMGVAVSGGAATTAGDYVAGAPKQETTPDVVGAYAGGGATFQLSNAGSVQQLAGPFQTISGNVGGGAGASVSLSFDQSGVFVFQVTAGPGVGVSGYSMTTNTKVGCIEGCD